MSQNINISETEISQTKLLIYQVDRMSEEGLLFRQLAKDRGCQIVDLDTIDLESNIKTIYARPAQDVAENSIRPDLTRGFCVLCGFTKPAFDDLLNAWKTAGVGRLALKAVATEHNQMWPLRDLFAELDREHELTLAYVALRKRVLHLEAALDKQGFILPESNQDLEPAMEDRIRSLKAAQQLLTDIRAIETVDEIITADNFLKKSWSLPG